MLYLLKDKDYFKKVIEILRERAIFRPEVWKFSCLHLDDTNLIKEYLEMMKKNRLLKSDSYFNSSLVSFGD